MKTINSITMVLALTACGSGGSSGDDNTTADAPTTHDGPNGTHDAPSASGPVTVFTIVLENHDYNEIVGSPNAPYVNSLIAQGALATNYKDTNHPSLPNYLHMISGADQYPGFLDVGPNQWPYFPAMQPNLGSQLQTAAVKWRSYQESMGTACNLTDAGNYATKHDPFLFELRRGSRVEAVSLHVDHAKPDLGRSRSVDGSRDGHADVRSLVVGRGAQDPRERRVQ